MSILPTNRSKIQFIIFLCIGVMLMFFQTSCNKDDECTVPRIDSITFRYDSLQINYLVPTKVVTIHGANLEDPSQVYVNQTPLNLLYLLVFDNSITFLVPSMLTNDINAALSDSIRVVKTCGESLIRVDILAAPPRIQKISNEYPVEGEEITLLGKYFSLLEGVEFPGGIEGTIEEIISDTACKVRVPAGANTGGNIVLMSKSGEGSSSYAIVYKDSSGVVCNFDDIDTWEGYGGTVSDAINGIPAANGNIFRGEVINLAPGEMAETSVLPLTINNQLDYPGYLTPDYFAIKMEMFVKQAWTGGSYRIEIGKRNSPDDVEFAYTLDYQPWNDSTLNYSYSSNRWETVTISLDKFNLKGSENIYLQSFAQLRVANYMKWTFVNAPADEGGETINELEIALDNIRIRQIKLEE